MLGVMNLQAITLIFSGACEENRIKKKDSYLRMKWNVLRESDYV